jgi:chromosome segregation ATPase
MDSEETIRNEIEAKKREILRVAREIKAIAAEGERKRQGRMKSVQEMKEIIVRNDCEKERIKKEIEELKKFVREHSASESTRISVEGEMKEKVEEIERDDRENREKEGKVMGKLWRLKEEVMGIRKTVNRMKREKEEMKREIKRLKEIQEEVSGKVAEQSKWISSRQDRREGINEMKYKTCVNWLDNVMSLNKYLIFTSVDMQLAFIKFSIILTFSLAQFYSGIQL